MNEECYSNLETVGISDTFEDSTTTKISHKCRTKRIEVSALELATYLADRVNSTELVNRCGLGKESIFFKAAHFFAKQPDVSLGKRLYSNWKHNSNQVKQVFQSIVSSNNSGTSGAEWCQRKSRRRGCAVEITGEKLLCAVNKITSCSNPASLKPFNLPLWSEVCKELKCKKTHKNCLRARLAWKRYWSRTHSVDTKTSQWGVPSIQEHSPSNERNAPIDISELATPKKSSAVAHSDVPNIQEHSPTNGRNATIDISELETPTKNSTVAHSDVRSIQHHLPSNGRNASIDFSELVTPTKSSTIVVSFKEETSFNFMSDEHDIINKNKDDLKEALQTTSIKLEEACAEVNVPNMETWNIILSEPFTLKEEFDFSEKDLEGIKQTSCNEISESQNDSKPPTIQYINKVADSESLVISDVHKPYFHTPITRMDTRGKKGFSEQVNDYECVSSSLDPLASLLKLCSVGIEEYIANHVNATVDYTGNQMRKNYELNVKTKEHPPETNLCCTSTHPNTSPLKSPHGQSTNTILTTETPLQPNKVNTKSTNTVLTAETPLQPNKVNTKSTNTILTAETPLQPNKVNTKSINTILTTETSLQPNKVNAKSTNTILTTETPLQSNKVNSKSINTILTAETPLQPNKVNSKSINTILTIETPLQPNKVNTKSTNTMLTTETLSAETQVLSPDENIPIIPYEPINLTSTVPNIKPYTNSVTKRRYFKKPVTKDFSNKTFKKVVTGNNDTLKQLDLRLTKENSSSSPSPDVKIMPKCKYPELSVKVTGTELTHQSIKKLPFVTKLDKLQPTGIQSCEKLRSEKSDYKSPTLEECLDGVPPFIHEVFKCENIRDGFINADLVFVLSLLPDIEEMTDTQRVYFQLKVIEILNDVMNDTQFQVKESVATA